MLEAWELATIFQDNITREEAQRFVNQYGQNLGMGQRAIALSQLISLIQMRVQIPPGVLGRQSVFQQKFKTPQIMTFLRDISNALTQRGMALDQNYDQYFRSSYINQQEFAQFIQNIGIRMINSAEVSQLFQYFQVLNETMISKVSLIQGLKIFQNSGSNFQQIPQQQQQPQQQTLLGANLQQLNLNNNNNNSSLINRTDTIQTSYSLRGIDPFPPNDSPLLQQFIAAARNYMNQNHGLSFEGLLQRFNVPINQYIEPQKFEEICLRLSLIYTSQELQQIVSILDQDNINKVKTSLLRQKIEINSNNSGFGNGNYGNNNYNNTNYQGFGIQNQNQNQNQYGYQQQKPQQWEREPNNDFGSRNLQPQNNQPLYENVRKFLQQCNITQLNKLFTISSLNNKEVIELQEFLNFLQSPGMGITQQQAFQIARECQADQVAGMNYQTQQFIDLDKFEQQLYAGMQTQLNKFQIHQNQYMILNRIYDSVRKHIMVNGGDILKFFQEVDLNHDNFISRAELKLALEKMGHFSLSEAEAAEVHSAFDQNGDGRISYAELCRQFAEFSYSKAITDPNHWAYYIFENIRRACNVTQKPLADLFGFTNLNLKSLQDKVPISKDQFFQSIARLNIPLTVENEKKLLELLDADSQNQWAIDFVHFAELVGIHYQPIQYQQILNQVNQESAFLSELQREQHRRLFRSLFDLLQSRNLSLKTLAIILGSDDNRNEGLITVDQFLGKIQQIDYERKVDLTYLKEASQKYIIPQGSSQFNYKKFLNNLDFEFGKYKILDFVFLTLKAGMEKYNIPVTGNNGLLELFQKFDRSLGMKQFDKDMLKQTLEGLGISLSQFEVDMILLEYDPHEGSGQKLDFKSFENDFRDFVQGKSQLSAFNEQRKNQYMGYQDYLKNHNKINGGQQQPNLMRQQTGLIRELLKKIGRYLDSNPQIKLTQMLLQNDVTKSGLLTTNSFQDILTRGVLLSGDESQHLIYFYDPNHRQQIKVAEFLNDLKEHVLDVGIRMTITELAQQLSYGNSSTVGRLDPSFTLSRFAKDFEEIQKAILIRQADTYSWFQSSNFGGHQMSRNAFRQSIEQLNLSYLSSQEIDAIFDALDSKQRGVVEISEIDDAIRRYSGTSNPNQMQNDVMERLIHAFNGDDSYLLKELMAMDKSGGRGLVDLSSFVEFFLRNAPQHIQFVRNDIMFVGQKYIKTQNANLVDINEFLSEFVRVRKQKNLNAGYYNPNNRDSDNYGFDNKRMIGSGHRNPLLPQHTNNNTRAELARLSAPPNYRMSLDPHYLEDLAKATYMREQMVQDYFDNFAQKVNVGPAASASGAFLQEAEFQRAVQVLGLDWTVKTAEQVFTQIDLAFNNYQRRMKITPEQIDQAVAFGCKRSIDDMHSELLNLIAQYASQKAINIRGEIQFLDSRLSKQITADQMKDIILNKLRIPQIMPFDVVFMCKKYILNVPNAVLYEKFLDDLDSITKSAFSNMGGTRSICEYMKKAATINKCTVSEFFSQNLNIRESLILTDLQRGCQMLGLIPEICNAQSLKMLFEDIDTSRSGKVSLNQLQSHITKLANKETRVMQDEIIDEIVSKVKAKSLIIENAFLVDDTSRRGYVPLQAFTLVLQRQLQIKEIDSKLTALRYIDRNDNVNYHAFLQDYKTVERNMKVVQKELTLLPNYGSDHNKPLNQRLKQLLQKINDFVSQSNNRIQLTPIFAQYEKGQSTGAIQQTLFLSSLEQLNLPIPNDDKYFLSENYLIPNLQPPMVDYRKFLQDVKLSTSDPSKQMSSLTKEQQQLYTNLSTHLKKTNKIGVFVDSIMQRDISQKFYLARMAIEDAFVRNGLKFSQKQFNTLFSVLDTNHSGEYNYKQMFSLLFGEDEANKIFSGGILGDGRSREQTVGVQFVMPQQTIGAASGLMAAIGKKLIQSNINYEEEIKKKIGQQQAVGSSPKATETEILDVLQNCKVFLSTDERTELQSYFVNKKDYTSGLIQVLDFLQALGLPAQTLGPRGQKVLPKKILNQQELKLAQDIIFRLRIELNKIGKKPVDIFEKWKQSNQDLSLPSMKFKLALAEFGYIGQQITDDQINLLAYYLAQEVPNEISYKKLYLAFTLTERDPPLKQEGAEEIQQYQKKLTEKMKAGVPLEIIDFQYFMREHGLQMAQIFKQTQRGQITRQDFEIAIKEAGFVPKDLQKLIEILDARGNRQFISLDKLNQYLSKTGIQDGRVMNAQMARDKYQGFDPKVRLYLQKISEFMKRQNITIQKMYEDIDVNRDGTADKMEFVNRMSYLQIPGVQLSDLGMIFDALDINNDGILSINEFGMFLEGAKATRMQRSQDLDPKILEEMKREILALFQQFDDNGDGFVTADEIQKAMMSLGQRVTLEDAKNMISQIDSNGDGKLDQREFVELMLPKMKEELLSNEDSLEDLRSMFLDADVDHSGTLSVDEIYSVILKMGAEITIEELIELMNEIDVNRDGSLDIDEFIALMSMGDEMQFRSANAKNTLINIKKSRKLHPVDFFKNFKNMPQNFVPSFFTEKWVKFKKNLPSSVFVPQIDPTTMLYKDLFPVLQENITPNQNQRAFQPRVRPLLTELGCQILLEEAQGVPLPQNNLQGFDRNTQIVKRMVRIGLYDTVKRDFILNAVQVNALYNQVDEDIWKFNAWRDNGTNPVLFKTANKDELVKPNIFMVFELVVAVKIGEKVTEMSCGWCQLDMGVLDRSMTHKLAIKGGSPNAEMLIKDADVHTNRTGMKYIMKVMQQRINSQLTVTIRPHSKFTEESKFHLDMLPTSCFIQKRLLYFVSGFRNYLGEKLLKESAMNSFKQPEGDVVISCFPKILDNPDICEQIISIWSEDVWSNMNARQKMNVEFLILKTKEYIQRLYPVLYSEEFKFKESDYTMSAAGDQYLLRKREELIKAALCFGNPQAKFKADRPLESLTTFKPFTVRELEFEVWDTRTAKQDRYFKQYEELGLIGNNNNANKENHNSFINPLGIGNQSSIIGGGNNASQMIFSDRTQLGAAVNGAFGNQQQIISGGQQQQYAPRSLAGALNNAFGQM